MRKSAIVALLCEALLFGIIANSYTANIDAGKDVRVLGTMNEFGTIRLMIQNGSINGIFELQIESFSGAIQTVDMPQGWIVGAIESKSSTLIFETKDAQVLSKSTLRWFSLHVESPNIWIKFKWTALDEDGNKIANGAFKVSNKFVEYKSQLNPVSAIKHVEAYETTLNKLMEYMYIVRQLEHCGVPYSNCSSEESHDFTIAFLGIAVESSVLKKETVEINSDFALVNKEHEKKLHDSYETVSRIGNGMATNVLCMTKNMNTDYPKYSECSSNIFSMYDDVKIAINRIKTLI